jgi:hypothetical protein
MGRGATRAAVVNGMKTITLAAFAGFGLPPTFLTDFRTTVDELKQGVNARLSSNKTMRGQAKADIEAPLADGLDAIHDVDVLVSLATREDPVRFAAWRSAQHIEGQASHSPHGAASAGETAAPSEAGVSAPLATVTTAADRRWRRGCQTCWGGRREVSGRSLAVRRARVQRSNGRLAGSCRTAAGDGSVLNAGAGRASRQAGGDAPRRRSRDLRSRPSVPIGHRQKALRWDRRDARRAPHPLEVTRCSASAAQRTESKQIDDAAFTQLIFGA